jgi:3-oxoacyl-[acyl-carrier protein] reductase
VAEAGTHGERDFDLSGKVALVTGSSRGIGRGIALALARHGADVAINCVSNVSRAEDVAEEIRRCGRRSIVIRADVAKAAEAERLASETTSGLGPIDILVNNAGIVSFRPLHEMPVEEWQRIIDADLTSVFLVTRMVLRSMIERRAGRIINISSVSAQNYRLKLGIVHYATAKGGLIAFTRVLAHEVAEYGITVNAIAPGSIATDINVQHDEAWWKQRISVIPLGHVGVPEDVALTAVFLASSAGNFYTGQVLCPNGGESVC